METVNIYHEGTLLDSIPAGWNASGNGSIMLYDGAYGLLEFFETGTIGEETFFAVMDSIKIGKPFSEAGFSIEYV